jgi:hypothetical protein
MNTCEVEMTEIRLSGKSFQRKLEVNLTEQIEGVCQVEIGTLSLSLEDLLRITIAALTSVPIQKSDPRKEFIQKVFDLVSVEKDGKEYLSFQKE